MEINLNTVSEVKSQETLNTINDIKNKKKHAADNGESEKANYYWRVLESIHLNIDYINAFDYIKNKRFRDGWNLLEQCEIRFNSLAKNSQEAFLASTRSIFIYDKITKLQSIFPYTLFISPGFKVGYYTCSICNKKIKPRDRCGHKKGKLYNGELCTHQMHDPEFFEISLVTNPVQKYSVAHDDSKLDFTALNYLFNIIENPFENWDLERTTKKFPIEKFSSLENNDLCQCKSGNIFKSCCIKKNEIEIPHLQFIFSRSIPESKLKTIFPY